MPLAPGSSRGIVGRNVADMLAAGHPRAQAIAASLSNARRHPRRAAGGIVPRYEDGGDLPPPNIDQAPSDMGGTIVGQYLRDVASGEMARRGIEGVNAAFRDRDPVALAGAFGPSPLATKWYHGTGAPEFKRFTAPEAYITPDKDEALAYASGVHLGGSKGGNPRAMELAPRQGQVKDINDLIYDSMMDDTFGPETIEGAIRDARKEGSARYLEYDHPSSTKQGEHKVRISLYPNEDLIGGEPGMKSGGGVVEPSRGIVGYAYGGAPAMGMGIAPQTTYLAPSTQTQNPQEQDVLSRFAVLPTEKLQELAVQFGNSGQDAALQRVLAQRHGSGDTASGIAPQPGMARGGYAEGGGPEGFGEAASMARHLGHGAPTTGFLHSEVPGRTDLIHAGPPTGAFVIPADVVSGVGQGNSLAGAWMLQKALGMGPLRRTGGVGIPSPPKPFTEPTMGPAAKRGGRQAAKDAQIGQPTHILAAGGEFIVTPDQVRAWGHGDMNRGHTMLDAWVVKKRKQIIEEMKALKGPKKG